MAAPVHLAFTRSGRTRHFGFLPSAVSSRLRQQEIEVNRTALRRFAAPGVAALALGLAVSACGAGNESDSTSDSSLSGTLKGAGSSAQEAAMDAWRAGFQ